MPFPFGALIGAGASLIGGAFDRKSEKDGIRDQNSYNDPKKQRKRLEAAGFNPAPFMGSAAAGLQTSIARPMMGNALANAGAIVTDEMARMSALEIEQARLDQEKEQFEDQKKQLAKANVGGIYSRTSTVSRSTPGYTLKTASPVEPQIRPASSISPPSGSPPLRDATGDPMGEKRAGGSTGANRENPAEFEADLYYNATEGDIKPYVVELYEKNFGPTPWKIIDKAADSTRKTLDGLWSEKVKRDAKPSKKPKAPKWADLYGAD